MKIKKVLLGILGIIQSGFIYSQSLNYPGHPCREANFDVLPGFVNPPKGYGEVPFYWWLGDTLTIEHLIGHLDVLKEKKISSLQINYAHTDKGGETYGLTFKSKPDIFTEDWWSLFGNFMKEAKKRGMTVSLSDYTLGVGQQKFVDEALLEHPEITGKELKFLEKKTSSHLVWKLPENLLSIRAFRLDKDSAIIASSEIDLSSQCKAKTLDWMPEKGEWLVTAVYEETKRLSYNPMHPLSGKVYIKHFFQQFEDRFPEESKDGLNFFFSDELNFNLGYFLWDDYFRDEFKKRKGYDIVPHLTALFVNVGDKTSKYRLDYNDVMVSLSEEHFFEPLYRWHEDRGLIFGCDHGGRGLEVAEFGDYFRTQRWNQGPGCDQPMLSKNIIKNKVASSIAHMYNRPRVWLEGFHSSGWDVSSGKLLDAIYANFVQGQNLLSLHGLYYSTPGGWWEWAPPCNHFRMPYWAEMDKLLACTERLSYLLSQGYHCADVAMLYPVEPVIAGNGKKSVDCAFAVGEELYNQGIDFDFIDYQSLNRAEIKGKELTISGESFKVLIIPDMETIYSSSIQKAVEFQKAGGKVICINHLPEATEKGKSEGEMVSLINNMSTIDQNRVLSEVNNTCRRDFEIVEGKVESPSIMHRRIGNRDLYAVYNVDKGAKCYFRSLGGLELWDPWTGKTTEIPVCGVDEKGSFAYLPLEKTEIQLLVFDSGKKAKIEPVVHNESFMEDTITGKWNTELIPVLNNVWGDYHWPATKELIGAEIRKIEYAHHVSADWKNTIYQTPEWKQQSVGFGDHMLVLDALPQALMEDDLFHSSTLPWQPYPYSWRWGHEFDYGHQGFHGLKEKVHDEFIRLGLEKKHWKTIINRVDDPKGRHYYLTTNVIAPAEGEYEVLQGNVSPVNIWINNKEVQLTSDNMVKLQKGINRLILHYEGACTTYFLFRDTAKKGHFVKNISTEKPLAMSWNGDLSLLPYVSPAHQSKQYYRFVSAPGLKALTFSAYTSNLKVWVNGIPAMVKQNGQREDGLISYRVETKGYAPESLVTMELESTYSGGSVFPYPIKQECGEGEILLGDWSQLPGLSTYSGGMWYRKKIQLSESQCKHIRKLDLGDVVSTAELFVNGKSAGLRMAAPWKFDLQGLLKPGENLFEVRVYNTISTHYVSIPSRYKGNPVSGIIGVPHFLIDK